MIITLSAGTVGGYILCQVFSQIGLLGKLNYTFPVVQITVFFIALVLIAVGYSMWAIHYCRRLSVIERIQTSD